MLDLRSYLLLTCDVLCCHVFLQGLLFEFRRKKQSSNEGHQYPNECCGQIHQCASALTIEHVFVFNLPTLSFVRTEPFLERERALFLGERNHRPLGRAMEVPLLRLGANQLELFCRNSASTGRDASSATY